MGTTSALPLLAVSTAKSWAAGEIVFNIPAGDLSGVLMQIGRIGSQPISFPADLTRGRRAGPIVGRMGVQEALARALTGTGLVIVPGPGGSLRVSGGAPAPVAGAAVEGDIAAIDVVDANAGSPYGDRGFQPGAAGSTIRIADAPLREVPIAVSVVTNEAIRSQAITNPLDAARNSAGVIVRPTSSGSPRFLIRGFETSGFAVNGQQSTDFVTGGQDVPIDAVDRVEVLKGPTAILTGLNSTGGGLVNLALKKPTAETIREMTVRYGAFNYKTIALDLGGAMPELEGTTYRFVSSLNHADQTEFGYRDPSQFLVMPSVTWKGEGLTLTTGLRYSEVRAAPVVPFGFRSVNPITREAGLFRLRGNGPGNPSLHTDGTNLTVDTEQTYHVGPVFGLFDMTINNVFQYTSARYTGQTFTFGTGNFGFTQPTTLNGADIAYNSINERLSMSLRYEDEWIKSTTKFGFDFQSYYNDVQNASLNAGQVNLLTNTPLRPLLGKNYTSQSLNNSMIRGGYMIEKLDVMDKLHILGMARWDWYSYSSAGGPPGRNISSYSNGKTEFPGYTFGALLDLPYDLGAYINRSDGRVFNTPVRGRPIDPSGRTLSEVGLRSSMFDNRFTATLSVYELRETDLTLALFNVPGFPDGIQLVPTAGLETRGIELEGQGEILPGWNLTANVSRLWARSLDPSGPGFTPTFGRPAYQGSLWTSFTWGSGWAQGLTIGAGVRALSNFDVGISGTSNRFTLPGYAVLDASIGYVWGDFSVNLKVNNLLDTDAFSVASGSTYLPIEPRRNAILQASYRF